MSCIAEVHVADVPVVGYGHGGCEPAKLHATCPLIEVGHKGRKIGVVEPSGHFIVEPLAESANMPTMSGNVCQDGARDSVGVAYGEVIHVTTPVAVRGT